MGIGVTRGGCTGELTPGATVMLLPLLSNTT